MCWECLVLVLEAVFPVAALADGSDGQAVSPGEDFQDHTSPWAGPSYSCPDLFLPIRKEVSGLYVCKQIWKESEGPDTPSFPWP